jgi:Uma2 family endonuclease
MAVSGRQMTAEELWERPDDGLRHELIDGELTTMAPSGGEHGRRASIGAWSLEQYVTEHGGVAYGAETGFLLARAPDLLRAPDAAYLREPPPAAAGQAMGYLRGAPDLAVEVISPSDHPAAIAAKVATWLAHGTRMVLVVYPGERRVHVHRPGTAPRELSEPAVLDGEDVLPGWRLALARLFA